MEESEIKELEEKLQKLSEFKDSNATELGKKTELVMKVDHICNANLMTASKEGIKMKNPKTGMVHVIKTFDDVIDFNEQSMTTREEVKKQYGETEE